MKTISTQQLNGPLGPMILAASPQGLCGVWFEGQRHGPSEARMQSWTADSAHTLLHSASQQLLAYFAGELTSFDLPLSTAGLLCWRIDIV